jgi:hypothetical protein
MLNRHTALIIYVLVSVMTRESLQDYIRSDEITLNDDSPPDHELVNLNALISRNTQQSVHNLLFKIVDDTRLVSYLSLRCVNDEKCLVVLKKKLDFADICASSDEEDTGKSLNVTCSQLLKIIALNQNDFIEIPILIRRMRTFKSIIPIKFEFPTHMNLNLSSQVNSFFMNPALVRNSDPTKDVNNKQISILNQKIEYKLDTLSLPDFIRVNFLRLSNGQLRLDVNFTTEQIMNRAFEQNSAFSFKILPFIQTRFLEENPDCIYELSNSTSLNVLLKINDLEKKKFKPLEFEYPIYSILIDNSLNSDQMVAEPRLKEVLENMPVVFTLLVKDENDKMVTETSSNQLPFYVDTDNGRIHLKKSIQEIFNSSTEDSKLEKTFSFGIKATYKQLIMNRSEISLSNSKTNYYFDYIIPAFAKIEIKLRREPIKKKKFKQIPKVELEFLTPFVSKYEILNEDTVNQTLVFYINDPIQVKSKLVKFYLKQNETAENQVTWVYDTEMKKSFIFNVNTANVTLINKNEFKDQNNYKTQLKLVEMNTENNQKHTVLSELNVEFRVDYDPILFEKSEYTLYLNQANLIEQNLVNMRVRERLNKNFTNNVVYRIKENELDAEFFDINPSNGWLRARQPLSFKNYFEIVVVATNNDLQKSGQVKCKVYVECYVTPKNSTPSTNWAKYSLFDSSSNRTQIGVFKSVCSASPTQTDSTKQSIVYSIDSSEIFIKFCSKQNRAFCKRYNFNRLIAASTQTSDLRELITLDTNAGYMTTNCALDVNSLIPIINDDYFQDATKKDVFDSNFVSLTFKASMQTELASLMYNIEIAVSNVPKIINFHQALILTEKTEASDSSESSKMASSNQCLFNYKFMINEDGEHIGRTNHRNIAGLSGRTGLTKPIQAAQNSLSSVPRFVRIDQNLGHFGEAEFKTEDCSAWFFIYNNGCLAMRSDHLQKDERCASLITPQTQSNILLKAGQYSINFKLCYYNNNNKVSCSGFYNQSITVPKDLHKSTRLTAKVESNDLEKILSQVNVQKDTHDGPARPGGLSFFRANSYGVYLISLFGLVILIAVIAITLLFIMFFVPKRTSRSDKAFVLPKSTGGSNNSAGSSASSAVSKSSNDLFKRNILEVSCETGNRTSTSSNSATHTPETSSNAPSSKISKLDEDHDEENGVKIQVTDDYLAVMGNNLRTQTQTAEEMLDPAVLKALRQFSANQNNPENFNYAGSFSSIGESTHSYQSNLSQKENAKSHENEQGLYSVKNAAIQYNLTNLTANSQIQSLSPIDFKQMYDQQDMYFKANLVDLPNDGNLSPNYECSYLETNSANNSSVHTSSSLQQQSRLNQPKMNSLKQLKKELALKKAYYAATAATYAINNNHLSIYNSNNSSGLLKSQVSSENSNHNSSLDSNNNPRYNEAAFQYLNSSSSSNNFARGKEVLLNPDNVIASVV